MKYLTINTIIILLLINIGGTKAMKLNQGEKAIIYEVEVNASPAEVYTAWTTKEGLQSFFAPVCNVDLKLFGDYQIHFFPENPVGSKGAEDEKILSFQENKMLSFTWGFTPALKYLRENQKTVIVLRFKELENGKTLFKLTHSGWGEGEDWDKGYEYFTSAWKDTVLPRLVERFKTGPIDWTSHAKKKEFTES